MCNSYRITPKRGSAKGIHGQITAMVGKSGLSLVRKSDPGIVMRTDGRVEIMRWGFWRSFNTAINNARSDKLDSGMWADAFRDRRCVIPVSVFYEWGPAAGGRKQAHAFSDPEDDFLWIAGIWEESADHGPCYSMVTTEASSVMAPIHNRMPAVLRPAEMQEFLNGGAPWSFRPFAGPLAVIPCESPLAKPRPPDAQQELF